MEFNPSSGPGGPFSRLLPALGVSDGVLILLLHLSLLPLVFSPPVVGLLTVVLFPSLSALVLFLLGRLLAHELLRSLTFLQFGSFLSLLLLVAAVPTALLLLVLLIPGTLLLLILTADGGFLFFWGREEQGRELERNPPHPLFVTFHSPSTTHDDESLTESTWINQ